MPDPLPASTLVGAAAPPPRLTRPLKVLHIHPKIGIGGVETYLCRLLAEMQRRGHETGLLTVGGVYEERIQAAGAHLFKLPVRKRIRDEEIDAALARIGPYGFDLVHAHNYRAARLGRALAERLDVPFLMSVHGPRALWHRLFFHDWSPWVVAMSEGDRDNITSFGGISRERVLESFYGIDTDRFRPGLDTAPLFAELGLPADVLPVVFVSRFAHRKAKVGLALIDGMPEIAAANPRALLLLVGEGPDQEALRARGEEVNRRAGRPIVRMVGPRRDVEQVMALAAVIVATANTALEGMACARPTLAAGRSGYFGEVTPASFEGGRAVCFADHGRLPHFASKELFARDVAALLANLPAAERTAAANRAIIDERYNIPRMADSTEAIYARVLKG